MINSRFSTFSFLATATVDESSSLGVVSILLSLIVIYFAAKLGGELCVRIKLPPVLSELVGGVILGISALNLLVFPETSPIESSMLFQLLGRLSSINLESLTSVFQMQSQMITNLAELGVIILLFEIGLESDLKALLRVGSQATIVALVGVVVPFLLGTIGLVSFFSIPMIPAIFAGAALTATSIGITAKVLSELGQLQSTEGQIIIGAAVIDDILGILILAVVTSLAKTGNVELSHLVYLVVSAAIFLIGAVWFGRFLSPFFVSIVNQMQTRGQLLISALIIAFVLADIASLIHLEAILGAFAAGLILAETEKRGVLMEQIKPIADMLVPIFFVVIGARTDLSVLNPFVAENHQSLIIAAFLIVVAVLGKVVTGFSVLGESGVNRWAIGVGMIPRGEVGLVFAAVGSASGVLPQSLNAAIIVMVILTTFLAPPGLRAAFAQTGEISQASG
ncbi:MAG: cation:proton antiporter [Leptolyngbyaceae cyanobacterium RM2_2_4]|nr:cation:proton antiporter [Leptolyngbyaceae cyanobacterium SM1_4_3]NJO49555.1 cation:proton antiporter [Leptolyngbyaceae cyanobacterium RM2_2_4]